MTAPVVRAEAPANQRSAGNATLVVVGIGADGWAGLSEEARQAIRDADLILGSGRQLALLPRMPATLRKWPSPMVGLIEELSRKVNGSICVLASGDPMLHGIGASLARRRGADGMRVISHPSAFALACARLGWPESEVELVSVVTRSLETVVAALQPSRRLVVYTVGPSGANELAQLLRANGFGASELTVLEQLGGPDELVTASTAADWQMRPVDPLHCVAVKCRLDPGAEFYPRSPGLPDEAFEDDGQLTRQPIRATTLAMLAPAPRALLWDVGAASGSIAIEWLRSEPTARAIAIEARADRVERAIANAQRLGVPRLEVICTRAPDGLQGIEAPDAIFIGGGLSTLGLIDQCWEALRPGGRIVANAVTIEGEQRLTAALRHYRGSLTRISIERVEPLGSFTGWRAERPIVQWSTRKTRS